MDFSIHFLARARVMHSTFGSWRQTAPAVFGEPARAITRNIIVIAVGFLPLLMAPLVPYKTVGVLLATILLLSGAGTLVLLPPLVALFERRLFAPKRVMGVACNCAGCIVSSIALVLLLTLASRPYLKLKWTTLTWVAAAAVVVLAFLCGRLSRRERCR